MEFRAFLTCQTARLFHGAIERVISHSHVHTHVYLLRHYPCWLFYCVLSILRPWLCYQRYNVPVSAYNCMCLYTLSHALRRCSSPLFKEQRMNVCVCVRKVLEYQFNLLLRSPLARVLVGYQPCVVSLCEWIPSRFTFMQSLLACLHPVNLKFLTS